MPLHLMDEIAAFKIGIVGLPEGTGENIHRSCPADAQALRPGARPRARARILFSLDEPTAGLDPIAAGEFDEPDLRT